MGGRRYAGPRPGLQSAMATADCLRWAWIVAGAVPGIGGPRLRYEEQPDVYVRNLSRTGAAIPLCDRRRSRGAAERERSGADEESFCIGSGGNQEAGYEVSRFLFSVLS